MQIVIDIDDMAHDWLVNGFPDEDDMEMALRAIKNGIVLPEKHGRLIDAGAIKKKYPLMYNDLGMEFNNGIHGALDEAPTILEATGGDADADSD